MKPSMATILLWIHTGIFLFFMLWGCSGGDGGNNGGMNPPPATMVAIDGLVHSGTPASPIANAACRFVERDGTQGTQAVADGGGRFRLQALPGLQGFIQCIPPGLGQLLLSTFISTEGRAGGDVIPASGREEVSPQTTVIVALIVQEDPANPQTRKEQLVAGIAAQDPDLTALVTAANVLYQQLLAAEIDATFDDSSGSEAGEGGNGGDDGDSGGVSGDVGDGAELSPIPGAHCSFSLELEGDALVSTVLHDLFVHGRVTRTDLQPIAAAVNQALAGRAAAIAEAFGRLFPNGIGQPLTVIAAGANSPTPGRYFLPVPPGLQGFVRCFPPEQENLVMATWVRPRVVEDTLTSQDVTPLATLYSLLVASQPEATTEELIDLQENFFDDVEGLRVGVMLEDDTVTGFEAIDVETVRAPRVGLAAFAATALYNVFFFGDLNATFLNALRDLVEEGEVDPARLAADPNLSPVQAATLATVVNTSTTQASEAFGTDLDAALDTARLVLRVRSRNNTALQGAAVTVLNAAAPLRCENCPATTAADGTVTLTLAGVPRDTPVPVTVRVTLEDFVTSRITVNVIALTRAARTIELARRGTTGTIGGTLD